MEKCILRRWREEDAPELAGIITPAVLKNLRDGIPFPYTVQDGRDFISSMLAADPRSTFSFAIVTEGRVAGNIGVFRQENIHFRTAQLGYYMGEAWQGRGIATSAVQQICELVFKSSDILRIWAEPFARNAASRRVLEKAGFTLEGVLRKNAVKSGEILDTCIYSLVREEPSWSWGKGETEGAEK